MSNAKQQVHKRAPGQIAGMADRVTRLGESLEDFPSVEVDAALEKLVEAVQAVIHGRGTRPVPKETPAPRTEDVPKAKRTEPVPDEKPSPRTESVPEARTESVPDTKVQDKEKKAEERKVRVLAEKEEEQALWARQYAEAKELQTIYRFGATPHRVALHRFKTESLMMYSTSGRESYEFIRESLKAPKWKYSKIVICRYILNGGGRSPWQSIPGGWSLILGGGQFYPDIPTDMKELRQVISANHPDKKNSGADKELYHLAVTQLAMVRAAHKRT